MNPRMCGARDCAMMTGFWQRRAQFIRFRDDLQIFDAKQFTWALFEE